MSEAFSLRRKDYSLSDEQVALRDAFRSYFTKTVGVARVRAAEPVGFDAALWADVAAQGVLTMGLPEVAGGDGAGLIELALVTEEAARRAAPVPIVETVVAARALARLGSGGEVLSRIRDGGLIATVALGSGERRLVSAGAVAEAVIAPSGEDLVLVTGPPADHVHNLAAAPLGWWELCGERRRVEVIGSAADFGPILRDWQILTAAALVGLGQSAVDLGVRYAKERSAFGTFIGAFQAVAHPLVDAAIGVEGARRLAWRAAWFADAEPESLGALAGCALLEAGTAAERAGGVAIHTQGGFGFTLESDAQLFYRRAKGSAVINGQRRELLRHIADEAFGPVKVAA